jgi:hypothetical protein
MPKRRNAAEAALTRRSEVKGRKSDDWVSREGRVMINTKFFASFAIFARAIKLRIGFRAKDAKDAKNLESELVKFVHKSFDVTFEEFPAEVYQ